MKVTASDPTYFTSLTFSPISNGKSTISYVPAFAKNGPVTITIELDDHQPVDNKATFQFTLTLAAVNHAPVANNDFYFPKVNTPFIVPSTGVFENDSEPDGDTLGDQGAGRQQRLLELNIDGSFGTRPMPALPARTRLPIRPTTVPSPATSRR